MSDEVREGDERPLLIPDEMTGEANPGGFRAASPEERVWHARNCWNCRKPRADCECIFP